VASVYYLILLFKIYFCWPSQTDLCVSHAQNAKLVLPVLPVWPVVINTFALVNIKEPSSNWDFSLLKKIFFRGYRRKEGQVV
jgi:hypothetical protein